jgi:preprotein translocase subunit Sec61beta
MQKLTLSPEAVLAAALFAALVIRTLPGLL